MNTLLKSALMSLLAHAIEIEPAVAGEVVSFIETRAAPQMESYVMTKVPALLTKLQVSLQNQAAAAPANVLALPAAQQQQQQQQTAAPQKLAGSSLAPAITPNALTPAND